MTTRNRKNNTEPDGEWTRRGESETRNLVNPTRGGERGARDCRVGIAGKSHIGESASEMRNLHWHAARKQNWWGCCASPKRRKLIGALGTPHGQCRALRYIASGGVYKVALPRSAEMANREWLWGRRYGAAYLRAA